MVCQACGSPLLGPFCSGCGARAQAGPAYPPSYSAVAGLRVQRHLQTLAGLWLAFGAYRALGGVIGAMVLAGVSAAGRFGGWGTWGGFGLPHTPWIAALVPVVVAYTLISSGLAFVTGFALTRRLPWGRTLAIVAGILALTKPVLGTALGIYTLWVLAPSTSGAEFEAIADRG